ncbi:hypothetical protein OHT57_31150 [Streptomyces sp. NBC_00285]|uniref:hypothetical protein n=1 Tax=Streptomyces sp. NBC_00285 TaxID=2975700 RepID=UPI002E286BF1|nr:hypothetical protein [Streptomyces sp. NBC_00285]
MTEYQAPTGEKDPWAAPEPYGYGQGSASALFIAAPLLTAAALSLAGVVGGADDEFQWPGPTLLLLVTAALALIASIQFAYHARLYLYSHGDLESWLGPAHVKAFASDLRVKQERDQEVWSRYQLWAVHAFNSGTILLGIGIAAALVPPDCGRQIECRWAASIVVLTATLTDAVWVIYMHMSAFGKTNNWFYAAVRRLIGVRLRRRG